MEGMGRHRRGGCLWIFLAGVHEQRQKILHLLCVLEFAVINKIGGCDRGFLPTFPNNT
jgi:hypothetical protein